MNNISYQYFLAVAEELNITKAAKKLYIAQQTLSEHILRLEDQYQVAFFERKPRFCLTYAGERFLEYIKKELLLEQQFAQQMQDLTDSQFGRLNIGVGLVRGQAFLPQIVESFHKKLPNIEVNCVLEDNIKNLRSGLNDGLVDLIIHSSKLDYSWVTSVNLLDDWPCVVVRDDTLRRYCADTYERIIHECKNGVRIEQIADCPVLMPQKGMTIRGIVDDLLFEAGNVTLKPVLTTRNIITLIRLARHGVGATFSNATLAYGSLTSLISETSEVMHVIPLVGIKKAKILSHQISYNNRGYLSDAARCFIETAVECAPVIFDKSNHAFQV